ncbi:LtfC-like domain-containing protein [Nocardia nova]|uniref:LtfC-like domain-containing protein n=1 Tax=Nocardia nova TaxID=37330 RepID=UPI001894672E|nr:hypothetical protein [Nocardia nova]MBF6277070.1 hypothetical protein [Nocardia nova]
MLTLGDVAGRLRLALDPAADFVGRIELQQPQGTPIPWPSGMAAWLHLSARGTTFDVEWPATIIGSLMSWQVPAGEVAAVPIGTYAELWLDYAGASPFIWVEGKVDIGCGPGGFGCPTAVPLPDRQAVAVPVPGPQGPPGGGAGSGFEYVQSTPAATWTISHGFGRTPYSLLVVVGGQLVIPDAEFPDSDTAVLTFASPTAGRAELS